MHVRKKAIPAALVFFVLFSLFPLHGFASSPAAGTVRVDVENEPAKDSYASQRPAVNGDKVIVNWSDFADNGKSYITTVHADGTLSTSPFSISPKTNDGTDTIVSQGLSNGNLLVFWYSSSSGVGLTDAYFKILNPNGNEVVPTTKINSSPGSLNRFVEAVELSNGNLAFVWATDGSNYALRRFTQSGAAVDVSQLSISALAGIAGSSQYTHSIAANDNGKFMIMITYNHNDYLGMLFNNDASAPTQINGQNTFVIASRGEQSNGIQKLATLPNGKFLAVYQKNSGAGHQTRSMYFKIYNDDGTVHLNEKFIRVLYTWGGIGDLLVTDSGFVLWSYYTDVAAPGNNASYLEFYNSEGVFQSDLASQVPAIEGEYGLAISFIDIDGSLAWMVNDMPAGRADYDTWLLRNDMGPQEYTVTFKDWNGSTLKSETVEHGSDATAPAAPSRIGHTFTGWDKGFTNITADTTVNAQYDVNQYTISFNSNGGSDVDPITADYGTLVAAPTAPTNEGYTFSGWYKEAALTNAWNFASDTVPVGGITLYAKWTVNTYSVTFKDWNGDTLKTETVEHGSDATAPADPARIGHTFTGWDKGLANITADTTVTAQYDANPYSVSFNSNGGSAVSPITADYGSAITAPAAPTKEGYRFDGWYKESALTNEWDFDNDTVPVDGTTLYAKWTAVYTVTYNGNGNTGGTAPADNKQYEQGEAAAVLGNGSLSKSGYSFAGWNSQADGKGESYRSGDALTIGDSNVILYAQWSIIPYVPPAPADDSLDILINGKRESIGKAKSSAVNGRSVTSITVDEAKLQQYLDTLSGGAVVTMYWLKESDTVYGELNGRVLQALKEKQASVVIQTLTGSYTLPIHRLPMGDISKAAGKYVELQDIALRLEITAPDASTIEKTDQFAKDKGLAVIASPLEFKVIAVIGDKEIELSKFNHFVQRAIFIPKGTDPGKITTAIAVDADGAVRHIPTRLIEADGGYQAIINSLTNSVYALVWHPVEFKDVENHWAKAVVNDMASRLVVSGVGDGQFSPDRAITRAEFAAIIVRGLGLRLEAGAMPFSDVKGSDWYSGAVVTAQAYGLINGFDDGTFRPNENITREQAMVIIAKAMSITELTQKLPVQSADTALLAYADAAEVSAWARSGVAEGLLSGVVNGRDGNRLAPKELITRAEAAAIVQRLLQKSDLI